MLAQLLLLIFVDLTKCAKILGVFPASGYSQFILGEKLMTELAKNGHDVTVISPYKPETSLPNYTTISTSGLLQHTKDFDLFKTESRNFVESILGTQNSGLSMTEYTLSEPKVQELLFSNSTFDLVIVEQFFCEALMGFGAHFDAPLILFSSIGPSEWNNNQMGNPSLPSFMPITKLAYTTKMAFFQRLKNSMAFFFNQLYKHYIVYPKHDKLLKKYFPKSTNLEDIMYNASLMLLNSHHSITDPFPLVTSMVEIGGFHIQPGELQGDLQEFLDQATDGAIYFSMGTNLKGSNLKESTLQDIIAVFSKLKQRVLWKFDGTPPRLPPNVLISRWLPQNDILGHPNVKLFISHGGLLSVTESVHFGVPMIGIPIFGDQKMNIAKAESYGFTVGIPYPQLSEDTLLRAITEVLENPKYQKNVKLRSRLYHDRPMKPLDLAMYWIEYVIRNNGAGNLKFAGLELRWYQLYLVDIIGFVLVLTGLLCLIIMYMWRKRNGQLKKTKLN